MADSEIIEGAELPSRPIKPNPQVPISGLILGFTLSLIYLFGKKSLDRRVRDVDGCRDVE